MGIDVGSAYNRASELNSCASDLRTAKSSLQMFLNLIEVKE